MNTSSICRTVWALVPLCTVLGLSSMPCQAQQRPPTVNEIQQLREVVATLERENQSLRSALEARGREIAELRNLAQKSAQDAGQQQIAELRKSEREAVAALHAVHQVQASQREVLDIQKTLLNEVRQLRARFEAAVQGNRPLPKQPAEDPFARKPRPKTTVPAAEDPFAR
jgi:chromosome segregation ATPase